ncbi:MAG: pentapeptide repeat-containing protein [Planctomycetota bacterium]|jgi:uncharacterized protein YjbI with pentapeptide repeats
MAKKNSQPSSQPQQPEGELPYNKEQYERLSHCSDKKDMTEWNKWREEHPDERVNLQGAPLEKFWLEYAHLEYARLVGAHLEHAQLMGAHLEHARLMGANLEYARLVGANLEHAQLMDAHLEYDQLMGAHMEHAHSAGAHLKHARLVGANLEHAQLMGANLEHAQLMGTHLEHAQLEYAHLEYARLVDANLEHARLEHAHLEDAKLMGANLKNAYFWNAKLQGADFSRAVVDGGTLFSEECEVDRNTKFEAVALGNMRIYPKTRQLLEYNIRRMNWEQWHKKHRLLRWPVRWFWQLSDYGLSAWRIIIWFFVLSLIFAAVYSNLAYWWPPGIVNDLYIEPEISQQMSQLDYIDYGLEALFRPIYFSVVTMTTLGFGDMYARQGSWLGHVLLTVQVILGYVLLGALITRFAILFTAGGPAGTFSEREPKEKAKSEEHKKPNDEENNK